VRELLLELSPFTVLSVILIISVIITDRFPAEVWEVHIMRRSRLRGTMHIYFRKAYERFVGVFVGDAELSCIVRVYRTFVEMVE